MSETVTPFQQAFHQLQQLQPADIRPAEFEKFQSMGLPGRKSENWKYTRTDIFKKFEFEWSKTTSIPVETLADLNVQKILNRFSNRIVFYQGHYQSQLSTLSQLRDIRLEWKPAEAQLGSVNLSAFELLNRAFNKNCLEICFEKSKSPQLLHVIHLHEKSLNGQADKALMDCPRLVVRLEAEAEAVVVETHLGLDEGVYFSNPSTQIVMNKASRLQYARIQSEGEKAFHVSRTRAQLEECSDLSVLEITTGAKLSRQEVEININGKQAGTQALGLYLPHEDQHTDHNTTINHLVENTWSHQLYKGVLSDQSRAVFNGKIIIQRNAQKVNSSQLNKNLLLSQNAEVDTKPELQIDADDVKANHGAAVGQIDKAQLFYLLSRGIEKRQAVEMLAWGFVQDVTEKVGSEALSVYVVEQIAERFQEMSLGLAREFE